MAKALENRSSSFAIATLRELKLTHLAALSYVRNEQKFPL